MAYDLSKVVVTSSPHIKADDDTRSLMLDVLIALVPALAVAVYTFGARALIHVVIAMVASLVFETIYNKIVHHPNTVGDLSCLVTGVLSAFNIPVAAPLWLSAFGALFGIIVVKMLFGGIGKNFMNPALGARAFMMASWAGFMTTWTAPHANLPLFGNVTVTDAISTATPLATLKTGAVPADTGLPPRWLCWQAAFTCCGARLSPSTFRQLTSLLLLSSPSCSRCPAMFPAYSGCSARYCPAA